VIEDVIVSLFLCSKTDLNDQFKIRFALKLAFKFVIEI